ncbi:MAG: hypothetical protein HQ526_08140 [Actinobacteria bacterium]|nr:hypothetical protein [Actinomycetota bacterium]
MRLRSLLFPTLLVATLSTGILVGPATADVSPQPRLYPSPGVAKHAEPPIYGNGCHSWPPRTAPTACVYGAKKSKKTVMLFGDSHAAHWFGAVRKISDRNRYRMLSVTKSSCPAADLHVRRYRVSAPHTSCYPWRKKVFKELKRGSLGRVNVAVISSWHFHQVLKRGRLLNGAARTAEWNRSIKKTLRILSKTVDQVVLLRDSPQMAGGMNGYWRCIERNQSRPRRCGAPTSKALSGQIWRVEKRAAKKYSSVTAVDLSKPFCGGRFCSPVNKGMLAFKDDNHWNQIYMRKRLTPQLAPYIDAAMDRSRQR